MHVHLIPLDFTTYVPQDQLPGRQDLDKSIYFVNVTYPRFLSIPDAAESNGADLLLELRVGRSGLGDDWLYKYTPNKGWSQIGRYLQGVNSEYLVRLSRPTC